MPKKIYYQKKQNPPKKCGWCQKTFVPKKYNSKSCSTNCSVRLSQSINKEKYVKKGIRRGLLEASIQNDKALIKDVEAFIKRMKWQSYQVNYVDCFILVDLYDRVFPKLENVPYRRDIQKSINEMFNRVVKWLLNENSKTPR